MSGSKELNQTGTALEYVVGTLKGPEKVEYENRLASDQHEAQSVSFWEEQLLFLNLQETPIEPAPQTWARIQRQISPTPSSLGREEVKGHFWSNLLHWFMPTAAAMLLLAVIITYEPPHSDVQPQVAAGPNADYIAVLTDESGEAVLSALTTVDESKMWIKWEEQQFAAGSSLQLWAISRRDGEVRSIAVFENAETSELALNETTSRLVTDASFLLLTREEPGGSALDEPSEDLIAKGVCVRFSQGQATI